MVAKLESAVRYPFNLKPMLAFGVMFVIIFLLSFFPFFIPGLKTGWAGMGLKEFVIIIWALSTIILFTLFFILLSGYMVLVSRSIIAGNTDRAPELGNIGGMLIDGLKFMVIGLAYSIPPLVVLFLAPVIFDVWGVIFLLPVYPLFYVFPLASVHLAATNSLKKALNIPYIYSIIFRNLKGFTVTIIFYFIATIALAIPVILVVTYPFILFATYVAGQYIFTIFYIEAAGLAKQE